MARITAQEFASRLMDRKLPHAVLLLGDQPFLRDDCRARLIDAFVPEAVRTWAISRFSAERGETQSALDQARTLPMLSPQQLVF
ncbi:MAG TPA: hypothetical protein VF758_00715, partial [Candidatus Acidoferrum sp.]